jgi:hypothetical protein
MIYKTKNLLDGTEASAYFSECGTYRYCLHRFWKSYLNKRLVFVLLNPSTATEEVDDPTIIRCRNRALKGNYYGVTVINLFAFRATDPNEMKKANEPTGGYQNIEILKDNLSCAQKGTADIICGWGCHGSFKNQDKEFISWFKHYGIQPMALRVTKDGHPAHPLYIPYTAQPVLMEAA